MHATAATATVRNVATMHSTLEEEGYYTSVVADMR